jgi:hypothetical protein
MLQAAIDLVGLSVYSWDLLAGTADRDDRIKAIWGLPPEAKVDLALACSAGHPDDVSGLDAVIARATDPQGNGIYRAEYRVIGIEDGSSAGYRATARPPLWTGRFPAEYPATAADCPGAKSVLVIITRLEPMCRCERLMLDPSSEDSSYCGCQAPSGLLDT